MNYALHLIVMIGMQLPTVLGYNLIFGKGKILHFGPIGTGIVTSYGIFLTLQATGSYPLALLAGLLSCAVISVLFAWLSLRLEGDGLGILSIALHLSLLAVVLNWTSLTRGALGLAQIPRMPGLSALPVFALVTIVAACGYAWLMAWVTRGSLGRSLGALAENRFHAEAIGIRRTSVLVWTFLLGGLGSFVGNVFFAQYLHLLHPNDYGFRSLVFMVMCVVAGGPGSVRGVTIATILLMILQESMRFLPLPLSVAGPLRLVLFGIILLGAVWARRNTIFPQPRTI
jgi:ABC-type branched-subunit amino acid transport system permease subunit